MLHDLPAAIGIEVRSIFGNSDARAFKEWAAAHAIPLEPLDGFNGDPEKLSILDAALAGKRIVFIGEQDHFVHQKYDYRMVVARYLFSRGWRWFGEEMGWSDGIRVDKYLASGNAEFLDRVATYGDRSAMRTDRNDDPTGILKDYWSPERFPQRQFKAEQVRFARGLYELKGSRGREGRIRFFGFDCDALPGGGYIDIEEILRPFANDDLVTRLLRALARIPGESIAQEVARLRSVQDLIITHIPHLEALLGRQSLALLEPSAFCLARSFAYTAVAYPAKTWGELNRGFAIREEAMHRSMERLLSRADSNDKFALMSHNMHLAKEAASMEVSGGAGPGGGQVEPIGTFLACGMPAQVFSIWMLCGRGRDSQPLSYMSDEVRSPKDSLNEMLCDVGPAFVLPLSRSDSLPAVLDRKISFVSNGNIVNRAVIPRQTDAIFFVRDVTPLRDFMDTCPRR